MRARLLAIGLLMTLAAAAPGAQHAADQATPLPIRRVVLYKSGVGYFEHVGSITGAQNVTIQFTTGQLNDVLQSLTALDLDGGTIASISYNSIAPVDQRLAALRLPLGSTTDRAQFYTALRGARVNVGSGPSAVTGRILSVDQQERTRDGASEHVLSLTIVSDEGAVRTVEITPSLRVQVDEREVRDAISGYLGVIASTRDEDVRRLTLAATGTGLRRLFVSYISEVPIWKSTYRLVLPSDGRKPVLQGWAVVDNTIGQDWTNVELSLVAGAPQSFIQPIAQPYYARRPIVPLPSAVLTQPQTHAPTLTADEKADAFTAAPTAAPGGVGGGRAALAGRGGIVGGVIGSLPTAPPPPPAGPVREQVTRLSGSTPAAATAEELGDLFEYKLKTPVTIRQNESALVPILNATVDAERVSIWNRGLASGRPLRGVWLTNASGLTLDGGSFTVIDADAFAGEGLVDPMKPGEKRLMSYGADLAVLVSASQTEGTGHVTRLVAHNGILVAFEEERDTWKYVARNEDTTARTLIVEYPLRPGWTVGTDPAPAETTPNAARYRVTLAPKGEATLTVTSRHAGNTTYRLTDLDDRTIALIVRSGASEPALRRALQPLLDARAAVAAADANLEAVARQITDITTDQARLRENMKALNGSAEEKALLQRYTRELDAQEDRLAALREDLKKATAVRDGRRAEFADLVRGFTFDLTT